MTGALLLCLVSDAPNSSNVTYVRMQGKTFFTDDQ